MLRRDGAKALAINLVIRDVQNNKWYKAGGSDFHTALGKGVKVSAGLFLLGAYAGKVLVIKFMIRNLQEQKRHKAKGSGFQTSNRERCQGN